MSGEPSEIDLCVSPYFVLLELKQRAFACGNETAVKAGLSKATKTNYNTTHEIHEKVYILWCDENNNKSELKCHFCCILAFYVKNQKQKWALDSIMWRVEVLEV